MGTLYIVSTPIGNLDDISLRALKTLFTVDAIACEDTRRSGQLLKLLHERYGHLLSDFETKDLKEQKLVSYYEQNEEQRIPEILNALKNGLDITVISDAGTPTVSDPGFRLVRECIKEKIKVIAVPGASSVLTALVASGLPTDKFTFLGYPPRKPGNRMKFFKNVAKSNETMSTTSVIFEAPHKLTKTLTELQEVLGDIDLALARELTKVHEEVVTQKISEHISGFTKKPPKGEYVILFNNKSQAHEGSSAKKPSTPLE